MCLCESRFQGYKTQMNSTYAQAHFSAFGITLHDKEKVLKKTSNKFL